MNYKSLVFSFLLMFSLAGYATQNTKDSLLEYRETATIDTAIWHTDYWIWDAYFKKYISFLFITLQVN